MAAESLKRPLSEVDGAADDAATLERIAAQVTENPGATQAQPKKKKPRVEERRSIFVRSLPAEATNETLTEFFSEYFPVKHATVITDAKTKQSRGYGFVTFADAEDAQQAKVALDKKVWEGRSLRIDIAEPRARGAGAEKVTPAGKPTNDVNREPSKLIVRNLPWSIKTPDQLSTLFRSFGKVKFADLPQTKGKLKGFGFVTIRGRKNSEKALESINGKEIDGRTLAVDWAVNRDKWQQKQEEEKPEPTKKVAKKQEAEDDSDATSSEGSSSEDEEDGEEEVEEQEKPKKPKTKEEEELDEDMKNFMKNHMSNMEDEDENEDDEEDEEDEAAAEEADPTPKRPQKTTDNSATLFIRNLPFTTTDEQLKGFFGTFGKVRYARIVMDKATGNPAGTGFVCFFNEIDAKTCIKDAPRPQQPTTTKAKHSILQDENADPDGKYTLDGRLLQVAQAVNKETAANLADSGLAERRLKDKRRLFLLQEGQITPRSPLFKLLGDKELRMRGASAAQRKKLVEKNPSLHLSLTRLALRNIPRNIGSKELKELARKSVVGFARDVKEGKREPLSKEENARDGKDAKEKDQERRQKGKGIVRQAKIVYESKDGTKVTEKSGAGKSRGYGFIEYTSHHWALMGLRYMNGHQVEGDDGKKQRLIVEFSIENAQVVQRRKTMESQSAEKSKNQGPKKGDDADEENQKTVRILKENKAARGKGGKKGKKPVKGRKEEPVAEKPDAKKPEDRQSAIKDKIIERKRLVRKKKARARGGN